MNIVIKTLLACLAIGLTLPSSVMADVYKYRDARGHIHLTDKPMPGMRLLQSYRISTGRVVTGLKQRSKPASKPGALPS